MCHATNFSATVPFSFDRRGIQETTLMPTGVSAEQCCATTWWVGGWVGEGVLNGGKPVEQRGFEEDCELEEIENYPKSADF